MSGRSYLSIGDVLGLLQEEFPDVTISKIRFLESQGLVNPERTPSGYRKFYEPDVERLRWVLRQQREHFLPLKVIKDRLEEEPVPEPVAAPGGNGSGGVPEPVAVAAATAEPAPRPAVAAPASPPAPAPSPPPTRASVPAGPPPGGPPSSVSLTGASLTLDELAAASGLTSAAVAELESYGLVRGRPVGGTVYYDEDALTVARLAAGFAAYGVEPRHLRLHKHAAEREAGFIEQVVLPLVKQRNPEARQRAVETATELGRLGQALRAAMLRSALRDQLGG